MNVSCVTTRVQKIQDSLAKHIRNHPPPFHPRTSPLFLMSLVPHEREKGNLKKNQFVFNTIDLSNVVNVNTSLNLPTHVLEG
jgi:hypothetical protein